jgi:hypothetical protein
VKKNKKEVAEELISSATPQSTDEAATLSLAENSASADKRSGFSLTKRIIALVLVLALLVGSIFLIRSCSAPPKYEEIEARFKELIEQSYELNVILFGEGLPTYPRIFDPLDSLQVYNTGEYYLDKDGDEQQRKVFYYYTSYADAVIVGFRESYLEDFSYALVSETELSADSLAADYPAIDGVSAPEGKAFYTELYRSADGKSYSYLIPFVEETAEFYYKATYPTDYDFVRLDAKYRTVSSLKDYAESIYSRSYTLSLYSSLFDGVASGGTVLKPRYSEYTTEDNRIWLTRSNDPEYSLFSERRVYLFDTAKIDKWSSNSTLVRISIQSYLPSSPDNIVEDEVDLVLQDGVWYLDSPTF